MQQIGIARALFDQQRHRVLVGRKEIQQRADTQGMREPLDPCFLSRQGPAMTYVSKPGSSPSTTMYMVAAMPKVY